MALPFRIGAVKKKATLTQTSMSTAKKAAAKKSAPKAKSKPATAPSGKKKAVLTQTKMKFSTGLSSEAGRVLATKTAGYRSSGSSAKAPTPAQRKAGKILAVCKHYGRKKCESPSEVTNILSKSKSTWKPVGAPNKRFTVKKIAGVRRKK
jgi:hypothetical protein